MRGQGNGERSSLEREVEERFGVLPAFFRSAPDAPEVVQQLWLFAKAAYLDSPLPPLFKERLFVYLSRFCEVRYCVVRHCGFLIGRGRPAGDPDAMLMTVEQALELLRRPFPSARDLDAVLSQLEAFASPLPSWPEPETKLEAAIFDCTSVVFLEPGRSERARGALRAALGSRRLEQLAGYLAFIRTAHFWTLMHPELKFEEDVEALLRNHEELSRRLLEDPEAGRCGMSQRLFDELVSLRREKDEIDELKRAEEQRDLLIAELSHRVKNTLATVQSIANQAARGKQSLASFLQSFNGRLQAMAHSHTLLAESRWGGVGLEEVLRAELVPYGGQRLPNVILEGENVLLRPKAALALGMILHELATNAAKHGSLSSQQGQVTVAWDRTESENGARLRLRWIETGGPKVKPPTRQGFGRTLIEMGLEHELNGEAWMDFASEGLRCILTIPLNEAVIRGTHRAFSAVGP